MFSRVCFTARSMVLAVSTIALVPIRWKNARCAPVKY